jgi:hypothetical protein
MSDTGEAAEDLGDLFSSYYGVDQIDDDSSSIDLYEDTSSFDSSKFGAQAYLTELLQTQHIEDLLEKDVQLVQEIRNLDSDMQMLVYENYSKFISATETIRRMKVNVEDMDGDMTSIDFSIKQLDSGSSDLDDSLAHKRSKVEKLVRVHRLLERLQFLSGLPEKLTAMIDQGSFKEAVQLYKSSSRILIKYSHILSFRNIEEQCKAMMENLKKHLLKLLQSSEITISQQLEAATVLESINTPKNFVAEKLLELYDLRYKRLLDAIAVLERAEKDLVDDGMKVLPSSDDDQEVSASRNDKILRALRRVTQLGIIDLISLCLNFKLLYREKTRVITTDDGREGATTVVTSNDAVDKPSEQELTEVLALLKQLDGKMNRTMKALRRCIAHHLNAFATVHYSTYDFTKLESVAEESQREMSLWTTYIQQTVLDVKYLSEVFTESSQVIMKYTSSVLSSSVPVVVTSNFVAPLHKEVLDVLSSFYQKCLDSRVEILVQEIAHKAEDIGTLIATMQLTNVVDRQMEVVRADSSGGPLNLHNSMFVIDQTTISRLQSTLPKYMDVLLSLLENIFEVYKAIVVDANVVATLYRSMPEGVAGEYQYLMDLPVRFVHRMVAHVKAVTLQQDNLYTCPLAERPQTIYTEEILSELVDNNNLAEKHSDGLALSKLQQRIVLLVHSSLFTQMATSVLPRIANTLEATLPAKYLKDIDALVQKTKHLLFNAGAFILDEYREQAANMAVSLLGQIWTNPSLGGGSHTSGEVFLLSKFLDHIVVATAVIIHGQAPSSTTRNIVFPPPDALRVQQSSREQLDIEKLFATPVEIFRPPNEEPLKPDIHISRSSIDIYSRKRGDKEEGKVDTKSKIDSVACTVVKASIKSLIENIRLRVLEEDTMHQIKMDMIFFKVAVEALITDHEDFNLMMNQLDQSLWERFKIPS